MRPLFSFGPLLVLTAGLTAVQSFYVMAELPLPESAASLSAFGLGLAIILWVMADARSRRCVPCHDFGFLVGVFMPVSLVWYLFWTRGWRGFGVLVVFISLVLAPAVISVVLWLILHK